MMNKAMRGRMRRWSSPKALDPGAPPQPNAENLIPKIEQERIKAAPKSKREALVYATRRRRKAERDERVDITRVLTPPKTYQGGFTRPTIIRSTHWHKGGYYVDSERDYQKPTNAAYDSHTVFLLESRYPVFRKNHMNQYEHIVGVCREGEFPAILQKYNSPSAPRKYLELMDGARWPWLDKSAQSSSSSASVQSRGFHSSALRFASDAPKQPSTTHEERANIPGSTWSRPPKPSQDANDDVVPTYYIERKRMRDSIAERKEEEGSLMAELAAGILSEGVAAETKVLPEKIPVEITMPDGSVVHPSGFEPPTPETDFHPLASKVATEDDPMLTTVKITWDEALSPSPESLPAAEAETPSAASPKLVRSFHSSAVSHASEVPHLPLTVAPPPPSTTDDAVSLLRKRYFPTLSETPFWRPLISLTFTTRPLALSIARLSRGLERGTPFHASIKPDERKDRASIRTRIRGMRIARMQQLTSDLTRAFQGYRGGIPGIRFSPADKGRGIHGEGLDEPIDIAHRRIKVGVASWHPFASEVRETFVSDAEANNATDVFEVFGIDERGMREDGVEWEKPKRLHALAGKSLTAHALEGTIANGGKLTKGQMRCKLEEVVEKKGEELMEALVVKNKGVVYP